MGFLTLTYTHRLRSHDVILISPPHPLGFAADDTGTTCLSVSFFSFSLFIIGIDKLFTSPRGFIDRPLFSFLHFIDLFVPSKKNRQQSGESGGMAVAA